MAEVQTEKSRRETDKQTTRLLKLLSTKLESGLRFNVYDDRLELYAKGRIHRFAAEVVSAMLEVGFVAKSAGTLLLTKTGKSALQERLGFADEAGSETSVNHRPPQSKPVQKPDSPLERLYQRKNGKGHSYLSDDQFQAGERLRSDFEKGQLQPRISANYSRAMSGSSATGRGFSALEITDFAMDARARLNRAIETLEPELAGVALDICCFLKGFELVERERQWPPRSAKLMLRTALSALSAHYGLSGRGSRSERRNHVWNAIDNRPRMFTA